MSLKLQNNFTTIEESKKLLELGVPEWTADMFYIVNSEKKYRSWENCPETIPFNTTYREYLAYGENFDVFKETIGSRVEPHIKVEYCFQKNDNIPEGYEIPKERIKPLGTAHAILCCKDVVNEPFMIINADDFYG